MCVGPEPKDTDAAKMLAKLLNENAAYAGLGSHRHTAASVRRMIRCNWKKMAPLAHTVHEEECREAKKLEARERAELARLTAKYGGC